MSETQSPHVAEAPSRSDDDTPALGCRDDWWHDEQADNEAVDEIDGTERPNPNEIVAHQILRETGTILCAATARDRPGLDITGLDTDEATITELFAWLDGEEFDPYALHAENGEIELTDPTIRLGNHTPESSLVGEYGTERHRKRYNESHGYLTGGETTRVMIQQRSTVDLMADIERWLYGQKRELRDSEIEAALNLARGLKKNQQQNEMDDLDIMAKVVDKVRR